MDSELIKQDANFLEFPLYVVNSRSNINKFEIKTAKGNYIYEASVNDVPDSVDALILYYLLHVVQKGNEFLKLDALGTLKSFHSLKEAQNE